MSYNNNFIFAVVILLITIVSTTYSFIHNSRINSNTRISTDSYAEIKNDVDSDKGVSSESSIASKMIFSLSEFIGRIASTPTSISPSTTTSKYKNRRRSLNEMATSIKEDYDNIFFATGNINISLYADNCTFSDPFTSFTGTLRFKENADNFSKFIISPRLKVVKVEEVEGVEFDIVKIEWIWSSKLKLPWTPVLAAAGVTSHYISNDDDRLIFKYVESWKSNKWDVIKRLFVPSLET